MYLPGLVCGLNVVCRAIGEPSDAVIVQTPVYPPFLSAPINQDAQLITAELSAELRDGRLYYGFDDAAFDPRSRRAPGCSCCVIHIIQSGGFLTGTS